MMQKIIVIRGIPADLVTADSLAKFQRFYEENCGTGLLDGNCTAKSIKSHIAKLEVKISCSQGFLFGSNQS